MTTRGWCPSLHEPMATGDGLLVRVKPPGGVLTAAAARLIAREAAAYGNGVLDLTTRANLQIRGLSPDTIGPFARAMIAAGLASADPAAERRRNVIAPPLADIDPSSHPATAAITAALESALEQATDLAALPPKFGFVVNDGGLLPVIEGVKADIRLQLFADHAEITSDHETKTVPLDRAVNTAINLAHSHLPLPPGEGRGEGRSTRRTLTHPSPEGRGLCVVGSIGAIAFGVALPFGTAPASTWSALADIADRHGDGKLRLTPWRAVLIAGLTEPEILADLDLIINPNDPRLRVSACPGQPACASASVPTRELAVRLRPPPGATIHVSGCDKGCAHPAPASLTLVGRHGAFDLVRHGRPTDAATQRGLTPAQVLSL